MLTMQPSVMWLDLGPEHLVGRVDELADVFVVGPADVVDPHIESPERFNAHRRQTIAHAVVADVTNDDRGAPTGRLDQARGLGQIVGPTGHHHDVGAGFGEPDGDAPPNALTRASDHSGHVGQPKTVDHRRHGREPTVETVGLDQPSPAKYGSRRPSWS
jgi:hypothetical protein